LEGSFLHRALPCVDASAPFEAKTSCAEVLPPLRQTTGSRASSRSGTCLAAEQRAGTKQSLRQLAEGKRTKRAGGWPAGVGIRTRDTETMHQLSRPSPIAPFKGGHSCKRSQTAKHVRSLGRR